MVIPRPTVRILDAEQGIVAATPKADSVLLVGHAPTRSLAATLLRDAERNGDPWEVWGCNTLSASFPVTPTRWFQLHPVDVLPPDELGTLHAITVPTYTVHKSLDHVLATLPHAVRYPIESVLSMPGVVPFFACTFAYQIALAVLAGFKRIALVGVELQMGSARERLVEHASTAYWIGYAAGRGVSVEFLPGTTLQYPFLYGLDYWREKHWVEGAVDALMMEMMAETFADVIRMRRRER